MKQYDFEGYILSLQETGRRVPTGQKLVSYSLFDPDGRTLFAGNDVGASPMHSPEGYDSAIAVLAWLLVKPGDTDEEFFKDHTPAQLAWLETMDAENLSLVVYDYENGTTQEGE